MGLEIVEVRAGLKRVSSDGRDVMDLALNKHGSRNFSASWRTELGPLTAAAMMAVQVRRFGSNSEGIRRVHDDLPFFINQRGEDEPRRMSLEAFLNGDILEAEGAVGVAFADGVYRYSHLDLKNGRFITTVGGMEGNVERVTRFYRDTSEFALPDKQMTEFSEKLDREFKSFFTPDDVLLM